MIKNKFLAGNIPAMKSSLVSFFVSRPLAQTTNLISVAMFALNVKVDGNSRQARVNGRTDHGNAIPVQAMAEESDEDDAPMPDAPPVPEPELIDMPPAQHPHLACRTWSGASLCASCTALDHDESLKKYHHHHITSSLCRLTRLFSCVVVFVLCVLPRIP